MATSKSFGKFSRRLDFRAKEVARNLNRTVRKVGIVADQALVFGTPVDKGTARSNWRVSINNPEFGVISAYAPGEGLGVGESGNALGAINQGLAVIAGRLPGQNIVIANNLPYIVPLNEGSSRQAPAGFVESAVADAAVAVAKARLLSP